ncbi:hypothetical protein DMC64_14965 [Amycolatopsis sp. WAC 04197]|uniref:hypothetical protein n=1 Tax=Amycolatopsis sp. WAC 04197 TaxID=2203199 RepID=UPI000F7922D6|nr:hypothetical protein [Amycolatopsis sp. WAC 04197]RSN46041.1 hypothetical protein DMC64_14965 [Amycolatopsis sp. WAC 04197]
MAENDFFRTVPDEVRQLASRGELAVRAALARGDARRCLRASVFEIAQPVVFRNLTRRLELKRGHDRCAVAVRHLDDRCLDRFHDDMEAVVDDVFRNARIPIISLEGWIHSRLSHSTVDGYRRRRSERGALQRPRVPRWLAAELDEDPTLIAQAVDILEFAGSDIAMGPGIWPTEQWAEYRVARGSDPATAQQLVEDATEVVLTAMRVRPKWYVDYVERPLGHKRLLSVPLPRFSSEYGADSAFRLEEADPLEERAAVAMAAIDRRIADGEAPEAVVVEVVSSVFHDEPWADGPAAVGRVLAAAAAR